MNVNVSGQSITSLSRWSNHTPRINCKTKVWTK